MTTIPGHYRAEMGLVKHQLRKNRMRLLPLIIAILAISVTLTYGEDKPPESQPTVYSEPILLTSAGQAADILIMKGLCMRAGLTVKVQPNAVADSLEGIKTLILVAGGSSKGLGAAKIDVGGEEKRIAALTTAAAKRKIPILTFHIGGEPRRGALSDPFNDLAAKGAEYILVAGDGDADGFFKKIAESKKARYQHVEKSLDVIQVLKELFGKNTVAPLVDPENR
ncbi:MAG: DUF6305 family protein [Calditrichota bacterium]